MCIARQDGLLPGGQDGLHLLFDNSIAMYKTAPDSYAFTWAACIARSSLLVNNTAILEDRAKQPS